MEWFKYRLIILLFVISAADINASFRSEVYHAYISNDMELWKNVMNRMGSVENKSNDLILELVNYQYGYIGYCLRFNKKDEAEEYLDLMQKNIDLLEKRNFRLSTIYAYISAIYGFRMEYNILSVPFYGLKSIRYAKLAFKLDSNNYMAYIQNGNVQVHMPASAGGSIKRGIGYYLKAREILEKDPTNTKENWNYLNLLIDIAQSYCSLNEFSPAKEIYEYMLVLEPDFIYVRDDLYPDLLKKMHL